MGPWADGLLPGPRPDINRIRGRLQLPFLSDEQGHTRA